MRWKDVLHMVARGSFSWERIKYNSEREAEKERERQRERGYLSS